MSGLIEMIRRVLVMMTQLCAGVLVVLAWIDDNPKVAAFDVSDLVFTAGVVVFTFLLQGAIKWVFNALRGSYDSTDHR
tara:strand:+ start:1428 stop:1661 length:234 start_codon:yes stop_codon:yes gene_type:complete